MVEKKQEADVTRLGFLAKQAVQDSERWFGNSDIAYDVRHHTLGMVARVGGFSGVVKEIDRGSLNPKDAKVRMRLATELTGVFADLLKIAGLLDIDLDKAYMMVRAQNERRSVEERAAKNGTGA